MRLGPPGSPILTILSGSPAVRAQPTAGARSELPEERTVTRVRAVGRLSRNLEGDQGNNSRPPSHPSSPTHPAIHAGTPPPPRPAPPNHPPSHPREDPRIPPLTSDRLGHNFTKRWWVTGEGQ